MAVYQPPQADTVHFFTDSVDGSIFNGCGCTKAAWIASGYDRTKFMSSNGDDLSFGLCDWNDTTKILTTVGNRFANAVIGMLIALDTGNSTNVAVGKYEITELVDANNVKCADLQADGDDTNCAFHLGGASNNINSLYDDDSTDAADFSREILIDSDISGVDILPDTGGGTKTKNTKKCIVGCDSDFVELTKGNYRSISGTIYPLKFTASIVNLEFRNLHPISSAPRGGFSSYAAAGVIETVICKNCKFTGHYAVYHSTGSLKDFTFIDCVFSPSTAWCNETTLNFGEFVFIGCYTSKAIESASDFVLVNRCVFDGDNFGVCGSGGLLIVIENTFYNQSVNPVSLVLGGRLVEFNNIYQLADPANFEAILRFAATGGTVIYSDYSITNSTLGGVDEAMGGEHCIKGATVAQIGLKDPDNGDFRLELDSLAWNAGRKTLGIIE